MRKMNMKLLVSVFIITSIIDLANGQPIGWRGPGRTGIYNEKGLMRSWPESGPALLWETTGLGTGYSSPVVTEDAIYITGARDEKEFLVAFTTDGKKKWETEFGTITKDVPYPESRCTPTVFKGKIFVTSGVGDLACITTDGKVAWRVNYYQKYNATIQRFGISESPLVVDNKVIVTPGGDKASVVAFNIENGNLVWETPPLNEGTQYTNPLLIEDKGMKLIVTHTVTYIIGVNAANGKLVWKFNFSTVNDDQKGGRNFIQTPLYRDGYLFAANGYGQTSAKIKISFDGTEPALVWKNKEVNPHVGGMVLLGNYIYSSTHDSNSKGRWICADWTTGKTQWVTAWNNKGAVISADGLLYILEEKNGNLALVNPNSEKLDIISSFRISQGEGPYWSHPVIDKGRLFVRHGDYLGVYSIKAK
ncbi:MAG: PQQ-binding-like beta-propeller repeat protein [Bacteroidales bacterium]|nr:PQQ-binding-like beta-propeller repeat protein [Bacteroidales bacterium]